MIQVYIYVWCPLALMACYSEPIKEFEIHRSIFEVVLVNDQSHLKLILRGSGIPNGYSLYCNLKEF